MLLHVERHQEDQDHEVRADLAETTNAWSGKHHFITWLKPPGGNPLRAVFFLQGHLFDDHKKMVKGIQMICKMFEKYLCCVLWCNMGPEAAETAYKEALERQSAMSATVKSSKSKDEASSSHIEKIEAQLAQAKLDLSYTKIYAPQDGYVSARSVEMGNYVNKAQPLMSVVSPKIWIVANFKETQVGKMKKGQPVTIKIDTYPNKKFKGKVDSIQLASGAKASLFPPENAVGSYIKVVQRIPVKIVFDEDVSDYTIAPGMSVVPKVKIK